MTEKEKLQLVESARTVQKNSYAPYSHFHVGAAVKAEDGNIYVGTNVENVSYGLTICAERSAIFNAVAHGVTRIIGIAVTSDSKTPTSPCGACRQVIREFSDDDTTVIMAASTGDMKIESIGALLPFNFTLEERSH